MPRVPPESIAAYSHKSTSDDIYELAKHLEIPKVILLGHDWGGFVAYRVYLHHPERYTHIMSICSLFTPIQTEYFSLEDMVRKWPSLTFVPLCCWKAVSWGSIADLSTLLVVRYQIALNDPQTDRGLEDPENRAKFLKFLYRSSSDPKAVGKFQVTGNMLEGIGETQLGSLLTEKVCEFSFLFQGAPPFVERKENTKLMD